MNKRLFLGLLFLTSGIFAFGQETPWPLRKCFDAALQNSIEIKMKQLAVLKAKKAYTHPLLELFPTMSLNGDHSYNFGSTIDPTTNNRVSSDIQYDNFYFNANVNLLNFNSIAQAGKEKIAIKIAEAEKVVIEYEYKLQILEKYYDALFTQELLKIQRTQLENSTFNLHRIEKEVSIGSKPQSDLYDIQLAFSQDEKRLLEAEQLSETQKLELFQLMNVKVENLSEIVFEPYPESEYDVVELETVKNPKVKFADLVYQSSRKDIAIQRALNLPRLSGYYNMSSFYTSPINQPEIFVPTFRTQFNDNRNQQAGLQLAIPVFNGLRLKKQLKVAKLESEVMKLSSDNEKLKIDQQIELENMKKNQYATLATNLENTLKYARESFKTTQSKFTNGKIEAITFTLMKNQLLSSEYDFLKNNLQLQYAALKINLIGKNEL